MVITETLVDSRVASHRFQFKSAWKADFHQKIQNLTQSTKKCLRTKALGLADTLYKGLTHRPQL